MTRQAGAFVLTVGLVACGDPSRGSGLSGAATIGTGTSDSASSGDGTDGGGSGADGGDGGSADGGDGGDGGDDGTRFDVATPDGGMGEGGDGTEGCQKVDFLFVVDNSESMLEFQNTLTNNWPAFITGIQDTLADVDSYQVGVISTDEDYRHNTADCQVLGGLIVENRAHSNSKICGPYANGLNFMTEADDLATSFSCAATMEGGSNVEMTMASLQAAVERQHAGVGQCNEGFLRDDSLLVVVILSDECDGPGCVDTDGDPTTKSPGDPQQWFDAVVAARGGIETNVVVLSLVQFDGGACPPPTFPPGAHEYYDGVRIKEFTDKFTHGTVGGICEADYGPYFQTAIGVIDSACGGFVPPG